MFILRFATVLAVLGVAHAQIVVATSSSGQTNLSPCPPYVAFVQGDGNTAQEAVGAVKGAAIEAASDHAILLAAAHTIPIPIVGPYLVGPVVGKVLHVFHPDKGATGFNVAFVRGVSAQALLSRGDVSFTIPAQSLQGGTPALMRMKISAKDNARIVRSIHANLKFVKTKLGSAPQTTVLGVDEDAIPSHQEIRNGDVVLTPNAPLPIGEYAIVLVPAQQTDYVPLAGTSIWDFRVM